MIIAVVLKERPVSYCKKDTYEKMIFIDNDRGTEVERPG